MKIMVPMHLNWKLIQLCNNAQVVATTVPESELKRCLTPAPPDAVPPDGTAQFPAKMDGTAHFPAKMRTSIFTCRWRCTSSKNIQL